jgi:hypothetical protein
LAAEKSHVNEEAVNGHHEEMSRQVSLRQRVTPFMDMLKRAQAAHVEVVWGV